MQRLILCRFLLGVRFAVFILFICVGFFCRSLFVCFRLAIEWYVFLQFTAADYLFGIFKQFF